MKKIIRSICYFTQTLDRSTFARLNEITHKLKERDFEIQMTRICTKDESIQSLGTSMEGNTTIACTGSISRELLLSQLETFFSCPKVFSNIDLTNSVTKEDVQLLFTMIQKYPELTFRFTYVFENPTSSPFFPSSTYSVKGFSIGLQSTDLSNDCKTLNVWCLRM